MKQNCKSIFLYNKEDELVVYVDLSEDNKPIGYYTISNRELTKYNLFEYKEKNKRYVDWKKAKIIFAEDCALHHMFLDGESRVVANKTKSGGRLDPPAVISRVYSFNDQEMEGYTIQPSLVQDWIKKL